MQKGNSYFLYSLPAIIVLILLGNSCSPVDRQSGVSQAPPSQRPLKSIHFTIQVGAFSNMDNAVRLTEKLQASGLNAYHFRDASNLYKVRFGNYNTKKAAQATAERLRINRLFDVYYIVIPHHIPAVNELRSQIVRTARKYIGTPYKWGGESAEEGFDCSGLTMTVYQLNGLDLPRTSRQQWKTGIPVGRHQLQEGDLVFFATSGGHRRVSHVGIYTGENSFIHAPRRGKTIRITTLSKSYYRKRYVGARRYL
jgi:cell wall-associated NlpC family hydrolase